MKNVSNPLCLLPRFHSQKILNDKHLERLTSSNSIDQCNSLSFENLISYYHIDDQRRFNQNYLLSEKISHSKTDILLLPRFHSDNQKLFFYDENQSADVTNNLNSQTQFNRDEYQEKNW